MGEWRGEEARRGGIRGDGGVEWVSGGIAQADSPADLLQLGAALLQLGQPRAQGKAAVLCLAQQLAEQMPSFAELLLPVAEKHGNASALSMLETFERCAGLGLGVC